MMTRLATGGRLGVAIGVAGAGKSTALAPLVEAWKADGREVFGITLAWRQAADLRSAGIVERASVAAFLKRVETGRYVLDRNSVVVVDEVGLIGTRQMLDLLRLQQRTGMQIVMVGDPKQCQSIEAGPVIDLLRKAVGEEAVPEILTSIRQKTEREREITGLFRAGRAAEALEMKQQDGTAVLVAGGRQATVQRVAQLWRERMEANRADPEFKLTVSAPTNADAREIGAAIRAERRRAGELGDDAKVLDATDRNGDTYRLALAVGDRVRLYDRVHDARVPGRKSVLANNGEVVEIRALTEEGMIVRNDAGAEGLVAWRKIQARKDAPVRLSYGYAMTVDTAQGSTATEHIHALPAGSHAIHGFKAYTAASRHERTTWIVVDEASERRHLASRSMIGQRPEIGEPDVWRQIGENLSRQPQKASALDHAAPDGRDAASGAAADRTAGRRARIKQRYPKRVELGGGADEPRDAPHDRRRNRTDTNAQQRVRLGRKSSYDASMLELIWNRNCRSRNVPGQVVRRLRERGRAALRTRRRIRSGRRSRRVIGLFYEMRRRRQRATMAMPSSPDASSADVAGSGTAATSIRSRLDTQRPCANAVSAGRIVRARPSVGKFPLVLA